MTQIGVYLVDEGVDVWAPVSAEHIRDDIYRILPTQIEVEQDCKLEFKPGSFVVVVKRLDDQGREFLAASRLWDAQ